ncbi:MAG: transposase, partial [Candidatus Chisholmbacteria bacterium]|nr:transposase [Candidatus Chisholmbacteria bacterium]
MPAKNVIKTYIENGFYHVYNRGVNKRSIFKDQLDYRVFLGFLKSYLSPPPNRKQLKHLITMKGYSFHGVPHQHKNYSQEISLFSYCLIPNHFHLLIKQVSKNSIEKFMRSLATRYVIYFNRRHGRLGPLFQNTYKAVLVDEEAYLLHLTAYIHRNPQEFWGKPLRDYPYSSY